MLKESQKAWASGFFDAEGTITIGRQYRSNRPSPAYRLKISASNTSESTLQPFCQLYGGRIYVQRETRTGADGVKWSDTFTWHCPAISASRLLKDFRPLLRVKSRQAALAINFIERFRLAKHPRRAPDGTFVRLPLEEPNLRDKSWRRMLSLNRSSIMGVNQSEVMNSGRNSLY
jgi:hypothetical protein